VVAAPAANRAAESKALQPSRPVAKGTSTIRREEDIFDTRK